MNIGRLLTSVRSVLLLTLLPGVTSGCAPPPKAPGDVYSAGYVLADEKPEITHKFNITNTTGVLVNILKAERSCTCASVELASQRLRPGEVTTLTMRVSCAKEYIKKSAACILTTDHPKYKKWVYTVNAVMLPPLLPNPRVLNLGNNLTGDLNTVASEELALDFFSSAKVDITSSDFRVPPELELSLLSKPIASQLQRDVWHTRYKATIRLSAKGREAIPENPHSGIITKSVSIAGGGLPAHARQFSVWWRCSPRLISRPSYLLFGNLDYSTRTVSRTVAISAPSGEQFRVLEAESPSTSTTLRIEGTIDSAQHCAVHTLTFKASAPSARGPTTEEGQRFFSGRIRVRTTNPIQPFVDIPWSASLRSLDQKAR